MVISMAIGTTAAGIEVAHNVVLLKESNGLRKLIRLF
jgi:hypothetical protein